MISARGPGEKLDAAPRVRATVRIKVQLLFLFALALLMGAAPAGAAEYTVVTCNGQAAATGSWTLFASGPNTALAENCAASGGSMAAVLRGQPGAGRVERRLAGRAPANTTHRRRHPRPQARRGGTRYSYIARGLTPAAANTQNFESCSTRPAARTRSHEAPSRGPRHAPTSTASRSTCPARPPRTWPARKSPAAEAAAVRISRADITLNDTTVPTISSPPSSPMFAAGEPGQRRAGDHRVLQGHRRWHRLNRHPGRRTDGERGARPKLDLSHALSPARPLPADRRQHAAVQSRRGARRPAPAARLRPRRDRIQRRLLAGASP